MFDLIFLFHAALYITLTTGFLLLMMIYNPRLMLQDYPPAIRRIVPDKTASEKRQSLLLGLPFLIILFIFPIFSAFHFQTRTDCEAGFLSLWYYSFSVAFTFNLWDWLIIDWLVFCTYTPQHFVIPGSEGHPAYKDYAFHFRGFLKGTVFSAILGLISAAIVELAGKILCIQ